MFDRPHYRLLAWQQAMLLIQNIYQLTAELPAEEKTNLRSQMRRAATSVASNIAEGAGRYSPREKKHFFHTARGSLSELETQFRACILLYEFPSLAQRETPILIQRCWMLLEGLISSIALSPSVMPRRPRS